MTLLDHKNYRIPDSAMFAIKKLKEKGHKLAIATGRDMDSLHSKPFKELLNMDATIELNGTKVKADDKLIHSYIMPKSLLNRLLNFAMERGYSVGLSIDEYDYYTNFEKVDELDIKRWGESFRKFKDVELIRDMEVRTLAYVGDIQGVNDIKKHFSEK